MTKWTDYVKQWAAKNGVTYGCALGKPEVSEGYRKANPKPLGKKAAAAKQKAVQSGKDKVAGSLMAMGNQAKERMSMAAQDINTIAKPKAKPKAVDVKKKSVEKPKVIPDLKAAIKAWNDWNTDNIENYYNEVGKLIVKKSIYNADVKKAVKSIADKYGVKVKDL